MPQYLKQHGLHLLEAGYHVLPIARGFKYPEGLKGWEKIQTTPELIQKWSSNGFADAGVGVNSSRTPGVDVDVRDAEVAKRMRDYLSGLFDKRLLFRTGEAPKFLVPFRCEEEYGKINSDKFQSPDGKTHKIEILGDGQQWVALHTHPDTGQPYVWEGSLLETPRAKLPLLTREMALRIVAHFEWIASQQPDWVVSATGANSRSSKSARSEIDDLDRELTLERVNAETLSDLRSALAHNGAKQMAVREWWIGRGQNLKSLGEPGWDLWSEASMLPGDHDSLDSLRGRWDGFDGSRSDYRAVFKAAQSFGWRNPRSREAVADHKPAPPHPEATETDPVPFVEGSHFAAGFEDVDWLIEDVLPRAQVAVIYGASGSGKTFLALDLACTIQRGLEWRGKHVEQADVFYIAAEAGAGLRKRIAAYLQVKGEGPMPWFVDHQPNLATLESVHAISESVKLRSSNAGVIFVDTLALSHDGDENSSKDMSIVLRHCKMLADNTGAMVILIHHTGKDDTRGMRGSSATYAAADCVLEVSADEKDHTILVDKLKDGERGASYGFTLPAVEVGVTPRGKTITSCYVLECEAKSKRGKKNGRKPLTHQAQIFIFDVFSESLGMADSMTETELVEAVKTKQKAADNVPSQSQSIKGSINKMVISGHICKGGESLSLPHSTHSTHSSSFE